MLYSETTGMAYFSVCKLFADRETHFTSGFNDWKHINWVHEHETASRTEMLVYRLLLSRLRMHEVDYSFLVQIDKEKVYRRTVSKRVVAVVKFLCERGLPLRGVNEVFGSPQNGNFLELLELLAQFDNFLDHHIRRFGNFSIGVFPIFLLLYATTI